MKDSKLIGVIGFCALAVIFVLTAIPVIFGWVNIDVNFGAQPWAAIYTIARIVCYLVVALAAYIWTSSKAKKGWSIALAIIVVGLMIFLFL